MITYTEPHFYSSAKAGTKAWSTINHTTRGVKEKEKHKRFRIEKVTTTKAFSIICNNPKEDGDGKSHA
jgi:hypothetical protein